MSDRRVFVDRRNTRAACIVLVALWVSAPALAEPPDPPDTERSTVARLSPREAAEGFRCPPGFRVTVFAAEPDVRNPVAMAWDTRGRLWIAENFTYSDSTDRFDLRLRDRVLIFEDADGDGRFDRRKVFTDEVQRLGSVELGFGGAWLLCPPQLLFVPDRDGDDVPDGPAQVALDGFGVAAENHHTFANGLRWGPDGWLYGRCGASSPGLIGTPGTAQAQRIPLRGGLWRYHPRLRRFEVLCHGTTNPWGHDWDALGEAFFINTVNGHLWHMIPGAHFARPHTIEPNPRVYEVIDQHADHYHWEHEKEIKYPYRPSGEDQRLGGGHAHSGLMIYLADQWPEAWRGKLLTLNFHGRRVNVDRLQRSGSGFVGRHEPDAFFAADPWFRGIDLSYGPDGGVYLIDWSDTGECHEHDGIHRNSGRIFRITHGEPRKVPSRDLKTMTDRALADLHLHANEWFVRQSRRVLAERAAANRQPMEQARARLREIFECDPDAVHKVRALCTLRAVGGADDALLGQCLNHERESIRCWAIRFLTDELAIDTVESQRGGPDKALSDNVLREFARLGATDPSGLVRLVLASTLQRLPVSQRAALARPLLGRAEDASDHNLPALIWMGLIPVAETSPEELVSLAADCRLPLVVRLIARRLGEDIERVPAPVNALLAAAGRKPDDFREQVLAGLVDALRGWRKARKPAGWDEFRAKIVSNGATSLRDRARELDVLFGDGRAADELRRLALDDRAPIDARKAALRTLIDSRPPDLRALCERLVLVRFLNATAVRGLSLFEDPAVGRALAASYRLFHPSERAAVIDALASRPSFARAMLDQVASGKIPREDLTAFHARQIRGMGDPGLTERLDQVWGVQRELAGDRRSRIARLREKLTPDGLKSADVEQGRLLYEKHCASCHKLYGHGGDIGPDLTGTGRDNLDYLLENLVDPSASVSADFRMVVVAMNDGRILNGLVRPSTERTLTLQTQTEQLILDRTEIDALRPSPLSLMPEGLLDPLKESELRDLVSYLMTRTPILPSRPPH